MALDPNGGGPAIDMRALLNAIASQAAALHQQAAPSFNPDPGMALTPGYNPGGPMIHSPGPTGPPIHQMPPPAGTDPRFIGPPVRPGGGNMKPPGPAGQYLGPPQQAPPIRMEQQAMAPAHVARAYANALRRIGNPRRGRQPYRPRYE